MKYVLIAIAAIVLIAIAFMKGFAAGETQKEESAAPCSPESILAADNPDARISHCQDQDWDGSTLLKDRLAEAQDHPTEYGILCEAGPTRYGLPLFLLRPGIEPSFPHSVPEHR